jgi:hypothetical protein
MSDCCFSAGIPKEEIVLGFHEPAVRKYTGKTLQGHTSVERQGHTVGMGKPLLVAVMTKP